MFAVLRYNDPDEGVNDDFATVINFSPDSSLTIDLTAVVADIGQTWNAAIVAVDPNGSAG